MKHIMQRKQTLAPLILLLKSANVLTELSLTSRCEACECQSEGSPTISWMSIYARGEL